MGRRRRPGPDGRELHGTKLNGRYRPQGGSQYIGRAAYRRAGPHLVQEPLRTNVRAAEITVNPQALPCTAT